jgi:hypothetical protein
LLYVVGVSAHPAIAVATWLWKSTEDIRQIVEFATARNLREVYLAIPLDGVDDRAAALAAALRANGLRCRASAATRC